jgi:cobalt-zinc-cadmium efflux system membrane fusion protein
MMIRILCALAVLGPAVALADDNAIRAALGGPAIGAVANVAGRVGAHDHGAEMVKLTGAQIAASGIAVAPAGGGTLSRRLTVPGTITLDPGRVARAPARVEGTVAELRKRLGDAVEKGEIVAILDSREVADAKTEFLTAAVTYDLKKTLYERARILWQQKVSAEWQYLQAEADFRAAQLKLDLARQKLSALHLDPAEVTRAARDDTEKPGPSRLREFPVRSPIFGRVIERKVEVGTAVGSDSEPDVLYTIADVSKLWIELAVPTAELDMVQEGQKVEILTDAASRPGQSGRIVFVSPLLDPDTRSARVIAEIDNEKGLWRPGNFVTTSIIVGEEPLTLRLPRSALQKIGGESVVFVQTDEGFERRDVTIGREDAESVEVLAGVAPGEPVAVVNTFLLKAELAKITAGKEH